MDYDFEYIYSGIITKKYELIGSGSGRTVFDLENGCVVKFARNRKGLAQNQTEYDISLIDNSGMLAKTFAISENGKLLIMEKAKKLRRMSDVWDYFGVKSNHELLKLEPMKEIFKHKLVPADFTKAANWGKIGDKLVIVDYGFTQSVRKKYYMLF